MNSDKFFEYGEDVLKPAQQEALSQNEEHRLHPQCLGKPAGPHQCSVSLVQLKVSELVQIASSFSKE